MKTTKLIAMAMVGLTLSFTPALAQRGGGGGSRSGGGGSHSSSSVSRSSSSGSSRSSFSSPSRSSSRSSRSYSSPSRSYSSPSRSAASSSSRSFSNTSRSAASSSSSRSYSSPSRSAAARSSAVRAQGSADHFRSAGTRPASTTRPAPAARSASTGRDASPASTARPMATERPSSRNGGYARPGRPGGHLPPAARPIRPAPYFHHPWHGHVVHCRPIYWHPLPPRPWYWPGFWHYCHSYWYDYHVTDVVVVRQYVQDTYNVDMVTYGISGDIMYAIVRDNGDTYLQVYDKDDHLLAEQKIHRKYCNMAIDPDNGGCWISKKGNKDALLFIWAEGQLLIYEAE